MKRVSVRETNIKLLLETVTYIAIIETVTCIITIKNSLVHNVLQKIPPAQFQQRLLPA